VAPEAPAAVVAAMAQPSVRIVTLTVTEKGYCLARHRGGLDTADPASRPTREPRQPRTAVGFLVAASTRGATPGCRRSPRSAATTCPTTARCCATRCSRWPVARSGLAEWIAAYGRVPVLDGRPHRPGDHRRSDRGARRPYGYRDEALVETERFSQWVLQDRFAGERPDFAAAGVTLAETSPRGKRPSCGCSTARTRRSPISAGSRDRARPRVRRQRQAAAR
jgi:fructuronate reductase